jgi:hypothetical protein
MTDSQGGVTSYVYDTLNLGSPASIWLIPAVLESSSKASEFLPFFQMFASQERCLVSV